MSACLCVSVPPFFPMRPSDGLGPQPNLAHIRIDTGLIRTKTNLTHPTPGRSQGDFRGSKIQKPGKCLEMPRKSIIFSPHPPWGWGLQRAQNFKSPGNFMNCRENRYIFFTPPPLSNWWGVFRGHNLKVTKDKVLKVSQNAIILSDYTVNIPGETG